jgi:hypothetical protein
VRSRVCDCAKLLVHQYFNMLFQLVAVGVNFVLSQQVPGKACPGGAPGRTFHYHYQELTWQAAEDFCIATYNGQSVHLDFETMRLQLASLYGRPSCQCAFCLRKQVYFKYSVATKLDCAGALLLGGWFIWGD